MEKENILKEIETVTELLYQQKVTEGYAQLNTLLAHLSTYVGEIAEEERQQDLLITLKEALEAMEGKDITLLADILQYELTEKL